MTSEHCTDDTSCPRHERFEPRDLDQEAEAARASLVRLEDREAEILAALREVRADIRDARDRYRISCKLVNRKPFVGIALAVPREPFQ